MMFICIINVNMGIKKKKKSYVNTQTILRGSAVIDSPLTRF